MELYFFKTSCQRGLIILPFTAECQPFDPKSDKNLISPYNIITESHIKVMRIKKIMITN